MTVIQPVISQAETMSKLLKEEPVPKVQIVGYELLQGDSIKEM